MATGHDIAMGLREAYQLMHRQTNSFLASFGLTADQFVLLALLTEQDGITQQELTQRAWSDPNTIRAMLVRMERNGFLVREKHPTDGRARKVILKQKGRQAYTELSEEIRPLQDVLVSPFPLGDAEILITYLDRISEAMRQWEHGHPSMKKNTAM
ncbi:MAG: MarR family transcriptional regulator [Sedimentisphaerales bacterium]|nr:MarR family transcriptional regulator [Sedimentisphaerales bacterium]